MSAPRAALLVNALWQGGAERVVLTVAEELLRRGREVELILLADERAYATPPGLRVEVLGAGARGGGLRKFLELPGLARKLAALSRERGYATVQSHLFRANYVNVLSRAYGATHRIQAVNHTKPGRLLEEGLSGKVNALLTRRLYPRADALVAISRRMAGELAAFLGLPPERIDTIPNPYDLPAIRELAAGKATLPGERGGRRFIMAMGRLIPLKRFPDLLQAFGGLAADFPDLDLLILGEGPERPRLEATARYLGLSERVFLPGFDPNPYPLLAKAEAFVLSSETEGFPNSLVESLALGLPILATDCASGPREILAPETDWRRSLVPGAGLEEASFGLLAPVGSIPALEEGIRRILGSAELRDRLRAAGPGRAAEFSATRVVDRYEALLFPEVL